MRKPIKKEAKGKHCFACGKILTTKDEPVLRDREIICKACDEDIDHMISEHASKVESFPNIPICFR